MSKKSQLLIIISSLIATELYLLAGMNTISSALRGALVLGLIGIGSYTLDAILKDKRTCPKCVKLCLLTSSLVLLSFSYIKPDAFHLGVLLIGHIFMIYSWKLYSYKSLAKENKSLGRYDLNLEGYLLEENLPIKIHDISCTGCKMEVKTELTKGQEYIIRLVHKGQEISLRGKVIREISNSLYGIKFLAMDTRQFTCFEDALDYFLEDTKKIEGAA